MKKIFARLVGPALGLSLCLLPVSALAAINLPFSTTYNCAEQQQGSTNPFWVTCDGIAKYGDWTTASGSKEAITTAANYSGGGGGRGQRHWIGNGTSGGSNSGTVWYSFSTSQSEIYMRWYVRPAAGLNMEGAGMKMAYFKNQCTQDSFSMEPGQIRYVVNGTPVGATKFGWDSWMPGGISDGAWHWFEIHLKRQNPNNANGTMEWWIDGVLRASAYNITFSGACTGYDGLELPSNHNFITVGGLDQPFDIDDVAIRTTGPIGPLGITPPVAPQPPAAPQNLQLTP